MGRRNRLSHPARVVDGPIYSPGYESQGGAKSGNAATCRGSLRPRFRKSKMTDSNRNSKASSSPAGVVFAADLGGTHLRAATVDEAGKIHFRLKQKTPQAETPDEIVQALVAAASFASGENGS